MWFYIFHIKFHSKKFRFLCPDMTLHGVSRNLEQKDKDFRSCADVRRRRAWWVHTETLISLYLKVTETYSVCSFSSVLTRSHNRGRFCHTLSTDTVSKQSQSCYFALLIIVMLTGVSKLIWLMLTSYHCHLPEQTSAIILLASWQSWFLCFET